ncbi:MAG: hypothetical protein ACYS76_06085 [Planctomycetota bacterium]
MAREAAEGLLVRCCRQVPVFDYHPTITGAYQTVAFVPTDKVKYWGLVFGCVAKASVSHTILLSSEVLYP